MQLRTSARSTSTRRHVTAPASPRFFKLVTGKARYSEPCLSRVPARSAEWVALALPQTPESPAKPPITEFRVTPRGSADIQLLRSHRPLEVSHEARRPRARPGRALRRRLLLLTLARSLPGTHPRARQPRRLPPARRRRPALPPAAGLRPGRHCGPSRAAGPRALQAREPGSRRARRPHRNHAAHAGTLAHP